MENRSLREIEIANCKYLNESQENILFNEYLFIQQLSLELNKENPKINFVNVVSSIDTQHRIKNISDRKYYLTMNELYQIILELISDDGYNKSLKLYNIMLNNTKEN